jgi:hypothetical protein
MASKGASFCSILCKKVLKATLAVCRMVGKRNDTRIAAKLPVAFAAQGPSSHNKFPGSEFELLKSRPRSGEGMDSPGNARRHKEKESTNKNGA